MALLALIDTSVAIRADGWFSLPDALWDALLADPSPRAGRTAPIHQCRLSQIPRHVVKWVISWGKAISWGKGGSNGRSS
jgi:hypothetical protein